MREVCRRHALLMTWGLLWVGLALGVDHVSARAPSDLKLGQLRVGKILFLGNSITLHGPKADIGWTGNWGMAASTREKDFVHRLLARIRQAAGGDPEVQIRNLADFERRLLDFDLAQGLKDELEFQPDLVIVALGENATSPQTEAERDTFARAFDSLLQTLASRGQPTILVRNSFWPDAAKDKLIEQATQRSKAVFVDLEKLGADPAHAAKSERPIEHAGVAAHPGDKGMEAIADTIWRKLRQTAGLPE
jgi:lysophospholipase L1-like esterase